jgi:TM2 domain-containing membrane protein YozV/ribosomal protein L40E
MERFLGKIDELRLRPGGFHNMAQSGTTSERGKKFCVNCGAEIDTKAEICPKCGVRVAALPHEQGERKSECISAVLSFVFVGLGQIYNGQIGKGIMFVIIGIILVLSMVILIGFILYPLFWVYNIYDAYKTAKRINAGLIKTE